MSTRSETKISSCYFCVWSKLRKLGGRESPRFPRVTPVVKNFSAHLLWALISYWAESHLESCQPSTIEFFENNHSFNRLTISSKKLHRRCSTGLRMCLRPKVLSVWGVGFYLLQVTFCSLFVTFYLLFVTFMSKCMER